MPVDRALRDNVRALLRRGERVIVLDLAEVTRIDAAGVGELVRAFNLTAAVNGRLRITNASPWVREVLERAGVFDLLSGEVEAKKTDRVIARSIGVASGARRRQVARVPSDREGDLNLGSSRAASNSTAAPIRISAPSRSSKARPPMPGRTVPDGPEVGAPLSATEDE